MTFPRFSYVVTRSEETLAEGSAASSHIETFGHPATAQDLYRIAALHDTDVSAFNICFTDVPTCAALGRVIEGPIQDFADIEAAETALRPSCFIQTLKSSFPQSSWKDSCSQEYCSEHMPVLIADSVARRPLKSLAFPLPAIGYALLTT
jgi:hypothetical protein